MNYACCCKYMLPRIMIEDFFMYEENLVLWGKKGKNPNRKHDWLILSKRCPNLSYSILIRGNTATNQSSTLILPCTNQQLWMVSTEQRGVLQNKKSFHLRWDDWIKSSYEWRWDFWELETTINCTELFTKTLSMGDQHQSYNFTRSGSVTK